MFFYEARIFFISRVKTHVLFQKDGLFHLVGDKISIYKALRGKKQGRHAGGRLLCPILSASTVLMITPHIKSNTAVKILEPPANAVGGKLFIPLKFNFKHFLQFIMIHQESNLTSKLTCHETLYTGIIPHQTFNNQMRQNHA